MYTLCQEKATIEYPTCITFIESFPGLKVFAKMSECQQCARDEHVPKLFSVDNNMHPGTLPRSYYRYNVHYDIIMFNNHSSYIGAVTGRGNVYFSCGAFHNHVPPSSC